MAAALEVPGDEARLVTNIEERELAQTKACRLRGDGKRGSWSRRAGDGSGLAVGAR